NTAPPAGCVRSSTRGIRWPKPPRRSGSSTIAPSWARSSSTSRISDPRQVSAFAVALGDVATDELLHDLVRAAEARLDAMILVGAGNGELEHVAVAAQELQSAVDDLDLEVGPELLGLRRVHRDEHTVAEGQYAAVDECLEGVDTRLEFGDFEASVLEFADRLPEGGA